MSALAAAPSLVERCEHCGTQLHDVCRSHAANAWVCLTCHLRSDRDPERVLPDVHRDETYEGRISPPAVATSLGVLVSMDVAAASRACARTRAAALSIPAGGGDHGCVLPGHDHAARLVGASYRCAVGARTLASVRASLGYDDDARRSAVELARWGERLDHEAGLRTPRLVLVELSPGCSAATRRVAAGWQLLVGLRDERWDGQPAAFARHFVCAWCGVTWAQARDAVRHLERAGALRRAGMAGRAVLWLPGPACRIGGAS